MNRIFGFWVTASALWLLGSGIWWYHGFATVQTQDSAIEECDRIYPPMPDGYTLDLYCRIPPCECSFPPCIGAAGSAEQAQERTILLERFDLTGHWPTWEEEQAKLHPQCAPKVGGIGFVDFIGMHASDREALKQRSMVTIQALNTDALIWAAAGLAGLSMIGLVFGRSARRRRSR